MLKTYARYRNRNSRFSALNKTTGRDCKAATVLVCLQTTVAIRPSRYLHCALSLAVQCFVIGPVRVFVGLWLRLYVCLWLYYHDNLK